MISTPAQSRPGNEATAFTAILFAASEISSVTSFVSAPTATFPSLRKYIFLSNSGTESIVNPDFSRYEIQILSSLIGHVERRGLLSRILFFLSTNSLIEDLPSPITFGGSFASTATTSLPITRNLYSSPTTIDSTITPLVVLIFL